MPFHYSLHIQREPDGHIEHQEYLRRDERNPMLALLERFRQNVGDVGSVLIWYEPFEKSRNTEMAAVFQGDLNERLFDLMKPIADKTTSDPALKGSALIKKVLPALVPKLACDDLDTKECASASRLSKTLRFRLPVDN